MPRCSHISRVSLSSRLCSACDTFNSIETCIENVFDLRVYVQVPLAKQERLCSREKSVDEFYHSAQLRLPSPAVPLTASGLDSSLAIGHTLAGGRYDQPTPHH